MKTVQATIQSRTPIYKMKSNELVSKRDELSAILEEAKALKEEINTELYSRAKEEPDKSFVVNERIVRIIERPLFSEVPLEFARKFKATKEVINGEILSAIYNSNKKEKDPKKKFTIPGLLISDYVTVSKKKEDYE